MLTHCNNRDKFPLEASVQKTIVIAERLVKASYLAESCDGCRDLKFFLNCQFHQCTAHTQTQSTPLSDVFEHRKP